MTKRELLPSEGHRVDPRFTTDEMLDDEDSILFEPLDRWGDARFTSHRSRWSEAGHPMTDWKA